MFILADALLHIVSLSKEYFCILSWTENVHLAGGRGYQLLQDALQWNRHFWNFQQQQSDVDLVFFVTIYKKLMHIEKEMETLKHSCRDQTMYEQPYQFYQLPRPSTQG